MRYSLQNKETTLLNWWNHQDQKKPVFLASVHRAPLPPVEDLTAYWDSNEIRYWYSMEHLSQTDYLGCAIPYQYIDFGSSAMAGALGCRMNPLTPDTIWPSHMFSELPAPEDISLKQQSQWYRNLYGMIDMSLNTPEVSTTFYALGGINDTLGSLYGEQNLLLDMYDDPERVKGALDQICNIWIAEKDKMWNLIKHKQYGMSSWAGIWAPGSTFPVQEDISFMLGPEHYHEFCLPYVVKCIESLDYPLYHLDGPNAIKHLDALLEIDKLKAIQWVPGAGKEEIAQWIPLIRKVLDSGKSIQIFARADEVETVVQQVGCKGLLITLIDPTYKDLDAISQYL